MKWGIPFYVYSKVMETETTTSEFFNGGIAIVEQILASRKKQIQKSRTVIITFRDPSRKVNTI